MSDDQSTTPPATHDSGLRCPQCDYNLTGLSDPRCPECGETFQWEAVRKLAIGRPTIAFERAIGFRKVPAFFLTLLTVLLAPWIFARQIVAHVDLRHALAFGALCFASTSAGYLFEMHDLQPTWLCTALVYVLLQAVLLTALDPKGWPELRATFRFWLLVGCYTSAVMTTEFVAGPPPLYFSDVVGEVSGMWPGMQISFIFDFPDARAFLFTAQTLSWLLSIGCCYAQRARHSVVAKSTRIASTSMVVLAVLVLYMLVTEYIGMNIYRVLVQDF